MLDNLEFVHKRSFWDRAVGVFLIFVGIAGTLLPILPGVPFLIVGLIKLFGPDHWLTRPILGKLKEAAHHVREWNKRRRGGSPEPDTPPGKSAEGSPAEP
jgi:uncharacterized membrane protein YbaN (DUF454 family)